MDHFRQSPGEENRHQEQLESNKALHLLNRSQKSKMFFAGLIFAIISFIGAHPIDTSCISLKITEVFALFGLLFAGISLLIRLDTPPSCGGNGYSKFEKVLYGFFVNSKINYWVLFLIGMFLLVMNRSILLFCNTH